MEPVTALGVAGNIVQFIDFGCKVLSKARIIYHDGAVVEHTDLRKVTEDLTTLITKLSQDLKQVTASLPDNEQELQELCEGCLGVARELEHALSKLNANDGQSRWKSIRAALKAVWGKDRLAELKGRLDTYSTQLDRRVLVNLRARINVIALEQSTEFQKLDSTTQAIVDRMKSLELTLDDRICQIQDKEATIMTSIQDFQDANMEEREQTRVVMSGAFATQQERSTTEHSEIRNDVISSIEATARINHQEHEATRREMELLRKEAEEQAQQLKEEIRLLKLEIERSIKEVVDSVGKVSAKEQRRLQEHSNAKFNLWVAKEIILKKLLEFLSLFKFNFLDDWTLKMDLTSWKIQTYSKPDPRKKPPERSLLEREDSDFVPEEAERKDSSVSTRISELDGGMTPVYQHIDLHYPIAAGNVAMVKWCLENGASANSFTELSKYRAYMKVGVAAKSPLLLAVRAGSMGQTQRAEIVSLLLEYGADPHSEAGNRRTVLSEAVVKQLPADDRINPDPKDQWGRTPLSWAAGCGQEAVVKQLLADDRVDPGSQDQCGRTPLSWAAGYGQETVVKQLLADDRVDPGSKDQSRRTPLWWAVENKQWAPVKLLLADDRVDPDSKDRSGRTPLWRAAGCGQEAVVKQLLADDRVDPDSKDLWGQTPLSWAAGCGQEAVVKQLLADDRVDPGSKDQRGQTPLSWAAWCGQEAVVKQLLADDRVDPRTSPDERHCGGR